MKLARTSWRASVYKKTWATLSSTRSLTAEYCRNGGSTWSAEASVVYIEHKGGSSCMCLCATSHSCRECNRVMDSKIHSSDKLLACAMYSPLWIPWTIPMTAQSAP